MPKRKKERVASPKGVSDDLPDLMGSSSTDRSEEDYEELCKRYLQPRDSDPHMPGGMTLRAKKASKPPLIDTPSPGWKELKRHIQTLQRQGNQHEEIYRILHQLRNWEIYRFRFPTIVDKVNDNEVQEVCDLTTHYDDEDGPIDVDAYILDVLLLKVVKPDPDPDPDQTVSGDDSTALAKRIKFEPAEPMAVASSSEPQSKENDDDDHHGASTVLASLSDTDSGTKSFAKKVPALENEPVDREKSLQF